MPYNNGFPMNYGQYYQSQQMMQPQVQQSQQPQIQNGGFMVVPSEEVARTYPVAPGNCVTFKIEGKPIVMEKSMGFSQLEAPRLDRYRLIREEDVQPAPEQEPVKQEDYLQYIEEFKQKMNDDLEKIWNEIDVLKSQVSKPITKKKDAGGN